MSKEEIEKLLDHYGVLFTEAIADKLLEIIARERADAIDEFKQGFYEHAHFEPWSMKFEIYQSDLLNWLEQLKEQK